MSVAKISLPDLYLTPEQNNDRRIHTLLTALNKSLEDLENYGIRIGPQGVQFTWRD